jgi:hypothetical protein
LGQGDDAMIRKLNEVIKELVQYNEVKKRVAEYSESHNQLMNDQKINELKNKIEELCTYVHGGGYLGGFDACELCDPHKLVPHHSRPYYFFEAFSIIAFHLSPHSIISVRIFQQESTLHQKYVRLIGPLGISSFYFPRFCRHPLHYLFLDLISNKRPYCFLKWNS